MAREDDIKEIRGRFEEVYNQTAEGHPLFVDFIANLDRRGKTAVLNDINEAAARKGVKSRNPRGWDNENLSI